MRSIMSKIGARFRGRLTGRVPLPSSRRGRRVHTDFYNPRNIINASTFLLNFAKKCVNSRMSFRFMVPYIDMITLNKNANYMYSVLKLLNILFILFRSTCFGHHCAHHQELLRCTCSLWSRVVLGSLCPPVLLCCKCYSYNTAVVTVTVTTQQL